MARVTCKNLAYLAAHGAVRVWHWPGGHFELKYTMERAAELHFSSFKRGAKGAPTLAHGVLGTVRTHLENFHREVEAQHGASWQGLSAQQAQTLAKSALRSALSLFTHCMQSEHDRGLCALDVARLVGCLWSRLAAA